LNEEAAPSSGGMKSLIFDFKERRLVPAGPDWKNAGPRSDEWRQTLTSQDTKNDAGQVVHRSFTVAIKQAGREVGSVRLPDISDLTAHALLPPKPVSPFPVPITALAYLDEHQQPWLGLYNAVSGDQIRRLNGHLDVIGSLSFSADGRLLAS